MERTVVMALLAVLVGLVLLVWSADRFVDGAVASARHLAVSPLVIGMVVVGFGTSAPEMLVSALSSAQGNPGIALGNAYGSNISNIALILGLTALISPIVMQPAVLRRELPLLAIATVFAAAQLWDGKLSRLDALAMLLLFAALMGWSLWRAKRGDGSALAVEPEATPLPNLRSSLLWLMTGLVLLVLASRLLVWGAVELARGFGVSDLLIGLTVVAVGTSLPELASSIAAARKGVHEIALGNVIGSNLFNTLVVVGIAAGIAPVVVEWEVLARDVAVMTVLTFSLFIIGMGPGKIQKISRWKGAGLVAVYIGYTLVLIQNFLTG